MLSFWFVCLFLLRVTFVSCGCSSGSVRLVDGANYQSLAGRLEVCQSGLWHSVCADENFCSPIAQVVCRQLGFSTTGAQVYGLALYGEGNGTVGLQNVSCTGAESNITQCNYTTPSTCPHSLDAAIHCNPPAICLDAGGHSGCCDVHNCYLSYPYYCWCDQTCHETHDCCPGIELTCPSLDVNANNTITGSIPCDSIGDVNFDDGGETAGRVLLCDTDYRWKTVCRKGFDEKEAQVVCRSQGLNVSSAIYNNTEYGQGTEDIFSKSLNCFGNESYLTDCHSSSVCCGHHQDVGLACQASCTSGDLRLSGGPNDLEGRLEVCQQGRWGTVCHDEWDTLDAQVACKTMGLPWRGAQAFNGEYTISNYGQIPSSFKIWLNNVYCNGTEKSLWNCVDESDFGDVGSCQHSDDASLKCNHGPCELAGFTEGCCIPSVHNDCQGVHSEIVCHCSRDCEDHGDCCIDYTIICGCVNFDIRLRDGTVPNEGRVEMCYKKEWGTICHDWWDIRDARVVCRQLGYSTNGVKAFKYAYYGPGTGSILLDNVFCWGYESRLIDCWRPYAIGVHNCYHYEDASVQCPLLMAAECVHGQARLVNGFNEYEGQLEVCYQGHWGTVCDDYFSKITAVVACRTIFPSEQLASPSIIRYSQLYFGVSNRSIVMDNVWCWGSETNIVNCYHITNHNCQHIEDVGLTCYPISDYNGQPRLLPGSSAGRLLVFTGTSWGTVCRDSFGLESARVVCRELKQPTESPRIYRNLQFNRGFGAVKYTRVQCHGTETHLNNCSKQVSGIYCSHYADIGVGCEGSCLNDQVRLVGGTNSNEGRVEICVNSTWGTICDSEYSWGAEEARVICKQLKMPFAAAQASMFNEFGPGPDPYHVSNIQCNGDESHITQCSKSTVACISHYQDVGVVCLELCTAGDVRLVDGTDSGNGRLEICIGGYWGTVCDDEFDNVDARIVCKQLGLPHEGAEVRYGAVFGEGSDHIAITSLFCQGHEDRIFSCFFLTGSSVRCSHANDVGVICQSHCTDGAIRLSGGESVNAGRVEVCYNGEWGTICQRGWNTNDATVACFQLGFNPSSGVRTFGGSKYGPAIIGPVYLSNVNCTGNESALFYCLANIDTTECSHSEDAGLRCDGELLPVNSTYYSYIPTLPVPGPVSNSSIVVINSTSVTVNWEIPLNAKSVITKYQIVIDERRFQLLGNKQALTISSLKPGYPYSYEIVASNIFGMGTSYHSAQYFFTQELSPNYTVILNGMRHNEYTIIISWNPLTLYEARGFVTNYVLQWGVYNESSQLFPNVASVSSDVKNFTIPLLLPSKKYAFSISAENQNGTGPQIDPPLIVDTTSSAIFQLTLNLLDVDTCESWTADREHQKLYDIVTNITTEVQSRCKICLFGNDHIDNERFQCSTNETKKVFFIAELFAPTPFTNETILGFIANWLISGQAVLTIDGIQFNLDKMCNPNSLTGFRDEFCAQTTSRSNTENLNFYAFVGVGLSTGIVAAVIVILTIISIVCIYKRKLRKPMLSGGSFASYYMHIPKKGTGEASAHKENVDENNFKETMDIIAETPT